MKLKDQVAVITGAGSGIGRATALRFGAEGARVVVAELNPESSERLGRELADRGIVHLSVPTDVGKSGEVVDLFTAIERQGWSVDILVNNAGTAEPSLIPTTDVTDERWQSMLYVHLNGTFYCIREALKMMLPRKRGNIINLGSVAGLNGLPGAPAYSAAKAGVIALTKAVSQEVAPKGIRVNCIAPGWINTPMLNSLPDKWRPGMVAHTPVGRLGEPEEVAALALFLASDQSSFITGQVISPNGGMFRW